SSCSGKRQSRAETTAPPINSTRNSVGAVLALASGKAERRQLHPLLIAHATLSVQFLLWQAAKPSGDNCTPY
ncbi:hypothetical protein, partial [Leyella stercorea]|uniref:hypothetical protein n=1 Tax=Leyella stercorea TaxID=363265 RepID=UPI00242AC2B0